MHMCIAFVWTLMVAKTFPFVSQIHHREEKGMTNLTIKQAMEAFNILSVQGTDIWCRPVNSCGDSYI